SKALRVVKEHVAPSLRPLCVSVLHGDDDSSKELQESISGIINYLAKASVAKLDKEIREIESERMELTKESAELRQKLRQAALLEYGRVEFDGEKILPAECARRIAAEREQHGWIPGAVSESSKCPLSEAAVKRLYRINAELSAEDRALLSGPLPSLEQLPSTKDFISYFDQFEALDKKIPEESKSNWERDSVSVVALERLKHHLAYALEGVELDARWFMACVQAGGEGGDRAGTWLELIDLIRTTGDEIAKREKLVVRLGPSIRSTLSVQDQIRILQEIILHLKSPKQFKKLKSLFHPEWTRLTQEAKTDQVELKWEPLFNRLPLQRQKEAEAARIVQLIRDQLIPLAGKQLENLELKDLKGKRALWLKTVRAVKPTEASAALLKTLEQAFKAIDYDAYDKAWKRLGQVLELRPAFEERKKLLQQLSEVAPRWAEAISLGEPPHDAAEPPGNLDKA